MYNQLLNLACQSIIESIYKSTSETYLDALATLCTFWMCHFEVKLRAIISTPQLSATTCDYGMITYLVRVTDLHTQPILKTMKQTVPTGSSGT